MPGALLCGHLTSHMILKIKSQQLLPPFFRPDSDGGCLPADLLGPAEGRPHLPRGQADQPQQRPCRLIVDRAQNNMPAPPPLPL